MISDVHKKNNAFRFPLNRRQRTIVTIIIGHSPFSKYHFSGAASR